MTRRVSLVLAAVLAATPAIAGATDGLRPFEATFAIDYGNLPVGSSRLTLRRDDAPGNWVFESRSKAQGLARLVIGSEVHQRSRLAVGADGVRPLQYRLDDGTAGTAKDVSLDFDWDAGRVAGTAERRPVDVATVPGLQDALTLQLAAMLELAAGRRPTRFPMIEKTEVKVYEYEFVRSERLHTAAGELDTVVYRSARTGGERYTLQWFAPALGWISVRSEQHRGRRTLFTLRLRSYSEPQVPAATATAARTQVRGSVTPFWPWYLPPRSL